MSVRRAVVIARDSRSAPSSYRAPYSACQRLIEVWGHGWLRCGGRVRGDSDYAALLCARTFQNIAPDIEVIRPEA